MRKRSLAVVLSAIVFGFVSQSAFAQSSVTAVHSDHLIESYRAYIGNADLFNSKGARLTQPWQIIRQDRANFHLYGIRDRDDETDSFFADQANRQALERMLINGRITGEAANMIVRGGVWIDVSIYGSGASGRWIDVTVSD